MGVELPLCVVVTLSQMLCYVFWSQVEYGIVCFILKVARGPGIRQGPEFGGKLK